MANLPDNMSGMAAPAAGGATSNAAFGATNPPAQGEDAGEAEQGVYNQFVSSGILALNDKAASAKIIRSLDTEDPREGVALVSAAIISRVIQAAKKSGAEIPPDVILHGTSEIVENVIERSEDAGVHPFSTDEKMVQGAMIRAFDEVRVALQGMGIVTKEGSAAAMDEIRAGQGQISGADMGADQGAEGGGLFSGPGAAAPAAPAAPPAPGGAPMLDAGAPPMNRQQRRAEMRRKDKGGM
jgi:hypothetical protein